MSPKKASKAAADQLRPRVEGDREQEILDAAIETLAEVGYDRLTMDAVASRAKASKATLYRRWSDKASLVIDALASQKDALQAVPDTGSLRTDLIETFCGTGGLADAHQMGIIGSVITATGRDAEFAAAFRERFIGPKQAAAREIYQRALGRGEVSADLDLNLIIAALPGIVLHRLFLLGETPSADLVTRVVDQVIIPAATRG